MGGKGFSTISQDPYSLNTSVNKNKKQRSKKVMNVVRNNMCSNLLHGPYFVSLSTMASFGREFESEIYYDYSDLDGVGCLNATEEFDNKSYK